MGAISLLLPVLAVSPWLVLALRRTAYGGATLLVAASFALGIGTSSLVAMWVVVTGLPVDRSFVAIDAAVWVIVGIAGAWWLRHGATGAAGATTAGAGGRHGAALALWAARAAFVVVACLAAVTALQEYRLSPHGEWDAWAVWNQKARFLVRGGARWTDELSIAWSNPSHPLLVPLTVARMWVYSASETTAAPALLAGLCGAGCVAFVMSALDLRRPRAWIAGAVLLSPAMFVQHVMTQQADVPTAFLMTAATVMLLQARGAAGDPVRDRQVFLLLSGVFAGFAAWTKNEGLLFAAAVAPAVLWTAARHRAPLSLAWWLVGLAPGLLTSVTFKTFIAPVPPPYFEESQVPWASLMSAGGAHSIGAVLSVMVQEVFRWGNEGARGAVPVALTVAVAAALRDSRARLALSVYLLMTAGFLVVFVASPLDAEWLTRTTYYRLLTQLWPILVLAAFLAFDRRDDHKAALGHRGHRTDRPHS